MWMWPPERARRQEPSAPEPSAQEATGARELPAMRKGFLSDEPADDDAFGGHERIANALATMIAEDEGGRSVALVGQWGSGKSTVVKLLEKALRQRSEDVAAAHPVDARVFTFDAWEHEGDPLRLSFLEGLVECLTSAGPHPWAARGCWRDRLVRLARTSETTTRTEVPVPTRLGGCLALSLLAVPVGPAALRALCADGHTPPAWAAWCLAGGAYAAVLAVVLACTAWRAVRRWRFRRRGLTWYADQDEGSVWPALVGKPATRTQSETLRGPDPTTTEFRRAFEDLLGVALAPRHPTRRLVIVMDNLDRVDREDGLRLWTTMRSFMAPVEPGCPTPEWLKRVWLIVPVASEGVDHLWRDDTEHRPAREFLAKTFHATIHVPECVLSDWDVYLRGRLREVFAVEAWDDRCIGHVVAAYRAARAVGFRTPDWKPANAGDARRAGEGEETPPAHGPCPASPTPRQMTRFVNDLLALYRSRKGQVPLPAQAAFVALASQEWQPAELADPAFWWLRGRRFARILGRDPLTDIAAIHFGVDQQTAEQLILEPRMAMAAKGEGPHRLSDLVAVPGFWETAQSHVEGLAGGVDHQYTRSLVDAFDRLCQHAQPPYPRFWIEIAALCEGELWGTPDAHLAHTFDTVLRRAPANGRGAALLSALCTADLKPDDKAVAWGSGAADFYAEMEGLGHASLLAESFSLPPSATPQQWLAIVGSIARTLADTWHDVSAEVRDSRRAWVQRRARLSEAHVEVLQAPLTRGEPGDLDWGSLLAISEMAIWSGTAEPLLALLPSYGTVQEWSASAAAPAAVLALRLRPSGLDTPEGALGALKALESRQALPRIVAALAGMEPGAARHRAVIALLAIDCAAPSREDGLVRAVSRLRSTSPVEMDPRACDALVEALVAECRLTGRSEWLLRAAAFSQDANLQSWLTDSARRALQRAVSEPKVAALQFWRMDDGYDRLLQVNLDAGIVDGAVAAAVADPSWPEAVKTWWFDENKADEYRHYLRLARGEALDALAGKVAEWLGDVADDEWAARIREHLATSEGQSVISLLATGSASGSSALRDLLGNVVRAFERSVLADGGGLAVTDEMPPRLAALVDQLGDDAAAFLQQTMAPGKATCGKQSTQWVYLLLPLLLSGRLEREDRHKAVASVLTPLVTHAADVVCVDRLPEMVEAGLEALAACQQDTRNALAAAARRRANCPGTGDSMRAPLLRIAELAELPAKPKRRRRPRPTPGP